MSTLLSSFIGCLLLVALVAPRENNGVAKAPSPFPDTLRTTPPPLSTNDVQEHISEQVAAGKPIVVHVMVALCDNENQGIVKVNKRLGNGQNPTTNLYWGAAYGVRTYLTRNAGYTALRNDTLTDKGILDRLILHKRVKRSGKMVDLYVVADAWDGSKIQETTWEFLSAAAGYKEERITVPVPGYNDSVRTILAGGGSALIAYVGHNGLMDFRFSRTPVADSTATPRSAIILACASRQYFLPLLRTGGSNPLLLTTHLMAPEAYSLEAAISSFATMKSTKQLHENVAAAYHKYQKCGLKAARRLFAVSFEE